MIHQNGSNSCQNQCAKQQCFVGLEKNSIACQLLFLHLNNIVVKHTVVHVKKETVDGDSWHPGYRMKLIDIVYDLVIVNT